VFNVAEQSKRKICKDGVPVQKEKENFHRMFTFSMTSLFSLLLCNFANAVAIPVHRRLA